MQISFHGSMTQEKIASIQQDALEELVERAYKVQYAIEEEISIDSKIFDERWGKLLGKNPQLKDPAYTALSSKMRSDLYLDFLAKRAEEVAVDSKVAVDDQEIKKYYLENKRKYYRQKIYTVSHVFVKVEPSSNEQQREQKLQRAQALYERAIDGEDFYNLAYYESDDRSKYVGGSLGSFHAGQTISEFDAAIKDMNPGEIVGPVQTRFGYHIIKLDEIKEEKQLEFEEVEDLIRAKLKAEKRAVILNEWLQNLKAKYPFKKLKK